MQVLTAALQASTQAASGSQIFSPALFVGLIVGVLSALIPTLVVESYRIRKQAGALKASLIAEVSALIEIAEERKYLESISQIVEGLRAQPPGTTFAFEVRIPAHYSRIYQDNAAQIGLLDKSLARDIVRFHQLVDAVVQDLIPGGTFAEGAPLEGFEQNQQIFMRALDLGARIARDA